MLMFSVMKYPEKRQTPNESGPKWEAWLVYQYKPNFIYIAEFTFGAKNDLDKEIARAMAEDYCEFLNRKYKDKEINTDWNKLKDLTGEE